MGQTIQIKRSSSADVPNSPLAEGELAYGHSGDSAGKLVIGRPLSSGSAVNDVIGGKFFVDTVNAATNSNTASTIVKRNASGNFTAGTITAALTGNVTGNVTGDVTGNLTGNVTGDVTGDVTGNVSGSSGTCTGNAATATTLATARTIHGVEFDGSADISLTEQIQDTVGNMFSGNTESGITVLYQDENGTIDLTVGTLNQSTSGNAATATALATARNISGVSFDGTADITLDADDIAEASSSPTNLYFTDTRAYLTAKAALNHSDHVNMSFDFQDNNRKIIGTGTTPLTGSSTVTVVNNEIRIGQSVAPQATPNFARLGIGKEADGSLLLDVDGNSRVDGNLTVTGIATVEDLIFDGGANSTMLIKGSTAAGITLQEVHGSTGENEAGFNTAVGQENYFVQTSGSGGGGLVLQSSFADATLGVGGAGVSDKQLKVHGDTQILGSLDFVGSSTGTDEGITFGNSTTAKEFKIKHDQSNNILSIDDGSTPVISIPDSANNNPNVTISRNTDFTGDVSVQGTLTIAGGTTTITSTELAVGDNVITLNTDQTTDAAATEDCGIQVKRGLVTDSSDARALAQLVFDESALEWVTIEPNAADTVTANAASPILTVANINSKTFTIDGGSFN